LAGEEVIGHPAGEQGHIQYTTGAEAVEVVNGFVVNGADKGAVVAAVESRDVSRLLREVVGSGA
jgi:hypothetical protein